MLVLKQPDLGTAIMLLAAGAVLFFLAGVRLWMFARGRAGGRGARRRSPGRMLHDYQKTRLYTFLDPERDPLGAGYHIMQSKIALGSGGLFGKGFLHGTQSHLNFLPEKQTDFIFTMIAEEFGLVGGAGAAGALHPGDRLRLCDRAAQPQPVRPAARRSASRVNFFLYVVHQHRRW